MADSPADAVGAWVGPIVGLGLGLATIRMVDRMAGGRDRNYDNRRSPSYIVYARGKEYGRFRSFDTAKSTADRLRSKGVKGVSVHRS